jgi:protein-S-isoprenylcysteine O-methyltransferase Ste14
MGSQVAAANETANATQSTPRKAEMARSGAITLYVVLMVLVVVSVDLVFFKNRFWERLMVNLGIVLVFAAFYLRFLKHP